MDLPMEGVMEGDSPTYKIPYKNPIESALSPVFGGYS